MERQADRRRLTAILVADVVGYSRLMGEDESGTVATLREHRTELLEPKAKQYNGRIIKLMGDGVLMEFDSVVDAVTFSVDTQGAIQERNADLPEQRKVLYRVGINIGDVIVEGDDIYGDGVNVAARLESLSETGGVCIAGSARDQIRDKLDLNLEDLGAVEVKNIARPVPAFRVVMDSKAADLRTPVLQSVAEPVHRSRTMIFGAAIGLAVLAVGAGLWSYTRQHDVKPTTVAKLIQPLTEKPSIAVLPFVNMSGDKAQEYFSDGITEDIMIGLSKIGGLLVVARNSSFAYKGKATSTRQIGRELNVRHILEGSVRKSGNRVRITAQLVDVSTGRQLWAERYDRKMSDIFAVQDEVRTKIVSALAVKLSADDSIRLRRSKNVDPDAYELLLRGLEALRRYSPGTNEEAREFFKKAAAIDPGYARAHANIAYTHIMDVFSGYTKEPARSLELAKQSLTAAMQQDSKISQIYLTQSDLFRIQRRYDKSLAAARKAIQLDPNSDSGYIALAFTLNYMGRHKEGLSSVDIALRLDPNASVFHFFAKAMALFHLERYGEAASALTKLVQRNPQFLRGRLLLAATYGQLGRTSDAEWEAMEATSLLDGLSIAQQRKIIPYKRQADVNRYLEGLRKAGLPE